MDCIDSREIVDTIKANINIVDIIGRYVHLNSSHMGLCPFHNDTHLSLSVSPNGQYYHCFGCGASGDVIDFLMRYRNMSFQDVLQDLAAEIGIDLPDLTDDQKAQIAKKRTNEEILTTAADYYATTLTPDVREYLTKRRGLTEKTITENKIGYADPANSTDSDYLMAFLAEKGFTRDQAVDAGVLDKHGREYFTG
jgi:DNA primase